MNDYQRTFTPYEVTKFHRDNATNKTGFLGVRWNKRNNCFQAFIRVPGRTEKVYCGSGRTPAEAALKYDRKARELFGPTAVTNFQ